MERPENIPPPQNAESPSKLSLLSVGSDPAFKAKRTISHKNKPPNPNLVQQTVAPNSTEEKGFSCLKCSII